MCVKVHFNLLKITEPFNAARRIITLPATLTTPQALRVVRAILSELAVPQPPAGAVCWCGEDVIVLPRVPGQRKKEEIGLGA